MWGDERIRWGRSGVMLVVAAALTIASWTGARPPAHAHVGGRVQLSVADFRLVPAGEASTAEVVLVDYDSGRRAPGFHVEISGHGSPDGHIPPTPMVDEEAQGRYRATLPTTPGSWTFTVKAAGIPGGQEAVPLDQSFPMTVGADGHGSAGRAPGSRTGEAAGESGSGSNLGIYLGMIGILVAAGATVLLIGRRRTRPFERHPEFG